jgi:hypothetical protein
MTPEEREALIADIVTAIHKRATDVVVTLSPEEIQYVRLAIQKESQSIKLRQAVIEKTITGLVWLVVVAVGTILLGWMKQHGYKE